MDDFPEKTLFHLSAVIEKSVVFLKALFFTKSCLKIQKKYLNNSKNSLTIITSTLKSYFVEQKIYISKSEKKFEKFPSNRTQ